MKSIVFALFLSMGFVLASCANDTTVPNEAAPADSVQAAQPDSTAQTDTGGNVTNDTPEVKN